MPKPARSIRGIRAYGMDEKTIKRERRWRNIKALFGRALTPAELKKARTGPVDEQKGRTIKHYHMHSNETGMSVPSLLIMKQAKKGKRSIEDVLRAQGKDVSPTAMPTVKQDLRTYDAEGNLRRRGVTTPKGTRYYEYKSGLLFRTRVRPKRAR